MAERFVLDASVTMAWCFEDKAAPYADAVLDNLDQVTAIAPGIWLLEVGNVLVVAERRGRLTAAETMRFLSLLSELPITVEGESPSRAWGEILALAREQRISTYDAAYLALAMRTGLPLATQDTALREAAARCGVMIYLGDNPPAQS